MVSTAFWALSSASARRARCLCSEGATFPSLALYSASEASAARSLSLATASDSKAAAAVSSACLTLFNSSTFSSNATASNDGASSDGSERGALALAVSNCFVTARSSAVRDSSRDSASTARWFAVLRASSSRAIRSRNKIVSESDFVSGFVSVSEAACTSASGQRTVSGACAPTDGQGTAERFDESGAPPKKPPTRSAHDFSGESAPDCAKTFAFPATSPSTFS
mmetsp:Transcript_21309/g.50067  ORF Transcript_21309/g.50067 Transcript_21309/m.50067 type:complete len:224 (-) Transcript_21309:230-901(-)